MGSTNGNAHAWQSLPQAMSKSVQSLQRSLDSDKQWQAFIDTNAIVEPVTIGVQSVGSNDAILVQVTSGSKTKVSTGSENKADFTLRANPEQWKKFFAADPKAPYTSFVGLQVTHYSPFHTIISVRFGECQSDPHLQGMNIKQEGVGIHGNNTKFSQYGHLSTRLLELLREGLHGPINAYTQEEMTEDHITGKYAYVDCPVWGMTKIFYETSGSGKQQIVFCHTAGSDSRQYHGVMNDSRVSPLRRPPMPFPLFSFPVKPSTDASCAPKLKKPPQMRSTCTMIAFDLPAHGRSFPGANYIPGNHTNNEEAYVGTIREFIRKLKLDKPIVCGASMAGQVCVAVAIRSEEVGAGGTIPMQGCDYLTMERQFNDKSPVVNQALFNPDWIWGMSEFDSSSGCPSAPLLCLLFERGNGEVFKLRKLPWLIWV